MNHPATVATHRAHWIVVSLLLVPIALAAQAPRQDSAQQCAQIAARIEAIDARMRLAYTGAAGERMREQRRRLQQQLWALRCKR